MIYLTAFDTREGDRISARKIEHDMGRRLLAFALKHETGGEAALVNPNVNPNVNLNVNADINPNQLVLGKHGKPMLKDAPGIHFNISHTDGLAVCAVSRREVGVDAERIRQPGPSLIRRVCSEAEQRWIQEGNLLEEGILEENGSEGNRSKRNVLEGNAGKGNRYEGNTAERFTRLWTLKESYVKATGEGLSFPLKQITFTLDEAGKIESSIPGWHFYQCRVYGKYIISVCEADQEGNTMTFEEMFNKVKTEFMKADVSSEKEHLAFQFNITGEGEGRFYAEVKEGVLYVEPYEYYDRDAIFTCSSDTLFKLMAKKLDPILAFTLGKLKVDGSIEQALKIQKFL